MAAGTREVHHCRLSPAVPTAEFSVFPSVLEMLLQVRLLHPWRTSICNCVISLLSSLQIRIFKRPLCDLDELFNSFILHIQPSFQYNCKLSVFCVLEASNKRMNMPLRNSELISILVILHFTGCDLVRREDPWRRSKLTNDSIYFHFPLRLYCCCHT